ncbi:Abi-alpha family protein [Helicobacter cholecystus]|uniref:Abi-alpha family protein n=1 Tax=Helicobacter cholecystus TaxID=45498 RepID=UPI0027383771|nr:Abi-alpha family protein [Helicobacter cholecystus]
MNLNIKFDMNEVYHDALQPAIKEIGKGLENIAKTANLILAPFTLCGAYGARFRQWCKRIENEIDEKNMQEAQPNILIPTLAGLAINPDETLLGEMFFNILKSSIDKTKQKFLSPAFPKILEQLSKDEAVMLVLLKRQNYHFHIKLDLDRQQNHFINEQTILDEFPKEKLEFQENLWIYNDHLHNLNLSGCWEYKQQEPIYSGRIIEQGSGAFSCPIPEQIGIKRFMEFRLTDFGKHFVEACISPKCEEYI